MKAVPRKLLWSNASCFGRKGDAAGGSLLADVPLTPLVSRAPKGTASLHTAWAAVLTVPRGQEVVVGAEGQGAYADFRVRSVSSGFQSLQGHRPSGDLIWNVTLPPLSQRTHTRDAQGAGILPHDGGRASDPVRLVQIWG